MLFTNFAQQNESTLTLIKSISGIRGTIGGKADENLTPIDVVKFSAAFGSWAKEKTGKTKATGERLKEGTKIN